MNAAAIIQPWTLIEKVVCFEIWQADMERVILRLDKPHRLDEQPRAQAEAKLIAAAPETMAALKLAMPILEAEREIIVSGYTNLSGPHLGEITDPEALEELAKFDAALAAGRAAMAKAGSS